MTKLRYIKLRNFQKWKRKFLKLHPRITTLVGTTDSGKSTCIRALRFLALNQPPRGRYITFGKDSCRIEVGFGSNVIVRSKSKKQNTYKINGKKQAAVRIGEPTPEVKALLNLHEVNFQSQSDLHFWFDETAGEVSRRLNKIVNLDLIDTSLSYIASEKKKLAYQIEMVDRNLDETQEKLDKLTWVPKMVLDMENLEALNEELEALRERYASLRILVKDAKQLRREQRRRSERAERLANAIFLGDRAIKIEDKADKLRKIIKEYKILEKESKIKVPDLSKLEKLKERILENENQRQHLGQVIQNYRELESEACRARKSATVLAQELDDLTGGLCPYCGKQMKTQ